MSEHGDCRRFFELLSELMDGELDRATGERIRNHLGTCPECRACRATFAKTVEIFRTLAPEPVPPGFIERLKTRLKEAQG
ncbi:MAG: anti-sigma factor [Thermodesulfobacteriota bacterium]